MLPFLRGGILVGVMELFQAVLGIVIGSRLLVASRSINFNCQSPQSEHSSMVYVEGEWVKTTPGLRLEDSQSYKMTSVHIVMALCLIFLVFMIAFAAILIWGIRYRSAWMIKLWLYPNVGFIILTGVVTLLISIFMGNNTTNIIAICIAAAQIGGFLIFRAFQCWIVNETLFEMTKVENDIPIIRIEKPDRFKNNSQGVTMPTR